METKKVKDDFDKLGLPASIFAAYASVTLAIGDPPPWWLVMVVTVNYTICYVIERYD